MIRPTSLGLAFLALTSQPLAAQSLPASVTSLAGQPLEQVGSGTARYLFWRVYDGALYAPVNESHESLESLDVPLTLILSYHRELEADEIIAATHATLEKQYPQPERRAEIDALLAPINQALQSVSRGDTYRLDFKPEPEVQLRLSFNDRSVFSSQNRAQAEAYFGLWLGEPPLSSAFKRAILNQ